MGASHYSISTCVMGPFCAQFTIDPLHQLTLIIWFFQVTNWANGDSLFRTLILFFSNNLVKNTPVTVIVLCYCCHQCLSVRRRCPLWPSGCDMNISNNSNRTICCNNRNISNNRNICCNNRNISNNRNNRNICCNNRNISNNRNRCNNRLLLRCCSTFLAFCLCPLLISQCTSAWLYLSAFFLFLASSLLFFSSSSLQAST